MAAISSPSFERNTKNLLGALLILTVIIASTLLLAWMFSPRPLAFAEDFENDDRNQQYSTCKFFTIEQGRLRITIPQSYFGCSISLPNEYEEYTFTTLVYPVGDVHDGSVNFLFGQNNNISYEIQFRPNVQQFNFIERVKISDQETHVNFTTGWTSTTGSTFNNSKNEVRLTVTKHAMDFWFNDDPIFLDVTAGEFSLDRGTISIGVGAGEVSGIAFEFDNIEIHSEKMGSRWMHDLLAFDEIIKWKK